MPAPKDDAHFGHKRPPRPEWLARAPYEDVIDPDLPIIDAHHHMWDLPGDRYLIDEVREDVESGHNVVATVFNDAGVMYRRSGPEEFRTIGETEFVAGIAAMSESGGYGDTHIAEGICARIDPRSEYIEALLDAHEIAAGGRLRGGRLSAAWSDDPRIVTPTSPGERLYAQPGFVRGARAMARRGLVWDAYLFHYQLEDVVELARAVPDLTIVVDHTGTPIGHGPFDGKDDEVFADWLHWMELIAAEPNTIMKLGGLTGRLAAFDPYEIERPLTSEELYPLWARYLDTSIELFGAERSMFQSNFPVDKGGVPYRTLWNTFKRAAAGASDHERAALFHDTASRVYRVDVAVD
jgi:L-fuconolactonase